MFEYDLDLKYKGSRDYLHGTDIFSSTLNCLFARFGKIENIDFAFHRQAHQQLKLVVGDSPLEERAAAVCSFSVDGIRKRAGLYETQNGVTERYPYPEDEIVSSMDIDILGRKGILLGGRGYSDIEIWVAMTKALHYRVFSQSKGKWFFVRGRFHQYTASSVAERRELVIASAFNDKLTRCEAVQDGVKLGEIYFSIV